MEAQNRAKESEKNNKNLQDHIRSQQKDKESEIQVSDSIYLLVIFRAWRCCLAHMTFSQLTVFNFYVNLNPCSVSRPIWFGELLALTKSSCILR